MSPVKCRYCFLVTWEHKWTGLGNENYNTEELQCQRWLYILYWLSHLTLIFLFYFLYDVISILHKDIENIWTICQTSRRVHLSPWTILSSVCLQILPLSAKGFLKRQQHLLMMLSTTSTVVILMRQVECGTYVCSVGLFQTDLGFYLLIAIGMSNWTHNFTIRRHDIMSTYKERSQLQKQRVVRLVKNPCCNWR